MGFLSLPKEVTDALGAVDEFSADMKTMLELLADVRKLLQQNVNQNEALLTVLTTKTSGGAPTWK